MVRLALLAAIAATPSLAEPAGNYDRSLEQSVMKIVAGRMGDIRGGFDHADRPVIISGMQPVADPAPTKDGWIDGLAPARQRILVLPQGR